MGFPHHNTKRFTGQEPVIKMHSCRKIAVYSTDKQPQHRQMNPSKDRDLWGAFEEDVQNNRNFREKSPFFDKTTG